MEQKNKYDKIRRHYEKNHFSICGDKTCPWFSNSTFFDLNVFYKSDMMESFKAIPFESKSFSAVTNWEDALTKQYGDYMQLPPEEDRIWKHHPILIDLEYNYE